MKINEDGTFTVIIKRIMFLCLSYKLRAMRYYKLRQQVHS